MGGIEYMPNHIIYHYEIAFAFLMFSISEIFNIVKLYIRSIF